MSSGYSVISKQEYQKVGDSQDNETRNAGDAAYQLLVSGQVHDGNACESIECAVSYSCHDDGSGLLTNEYHDRREQHTESDHHEYAGNWMFRIVVAHQNDRCVPKAPDKAYEKAQRLLEEGEIHFDDEPWLEMEADIWKID